MRRLPYTSATRFAVLVFGLLTAPASGTLVHVAMAEAATADPIASNNDGSDPASRVTTVSRCYPRF